MTEFLSSKVCYELLNKLIKWRSVEATTLIQRNFVQSLISNGCAVREGKYISCSLTQQKELASLLNRFIVFQPKSTDLAPGLYSERVLSSMFKSHSKDSLSKNEKLELAKEGYFVKEDSELFIKAGTSVLVDGQRILDVMQTYRWMIYDYVGVDRVLSIENKGYFKDYEPFANEIVVFCPGLDVVNVADFCKEFSPLTPVLHVPDLDPRGVVIASALMSEIENIFSIKLPATLNKLSPFIQQMTPDKQSWGESFAIKGTVLEELMEMNSWIEEEVFVILTESDFIEVALG